MQFRFASDLPQCELALPFTVSCAVSAMFPAGVINNYASNGGGGFVIFQSVMQDQFTGISATLLEQAQDEFVLQQIARIVTDNGVNAVTISVSTRFVTALGSPLPLVTLEAALETLFGIPSESIENIEVRINAGCSACSRRGTVYKQCCERTAVHDHLHVRQRCEERPRHAQCASGQLVVRHHTPVWSVGAVCVGDGAHPGACDAAFVC